MLPKILSLVTIVVLPAWMLYFLMGSAPLLILKHDQPDDARLVRGFFDVHYLVLMIIATIGSVSSAIAHRWILTTAIATVALIGCTARRLIVSRMDRLRSTMTATDAPAISSFRKLHVRGLALNTMMLAGFLTALGFSSAEIVSCIQVPPGCSGDACRLQCSLLA
jgi:hypothetical protein